MSDHGNRLKRAAGCGLLLVAPLAAPDTGQSGWVPRPQLPVEQPESAPADPDDARPPRQNGDQDTAVARAPTLDRAALTAFVEGFVTGRMRAHDAVGVTVSVVHGGQLVYAQGFGHADLDTRRPVLADLTLFRPGSISKTFTWTAVMQLVEQGRLDLDTDIQAYLPDLEIPRTFAEPITLAHLMSHTPGFEESALGHLFVQDPDRVRPLLDYLRTYQPARVRPPGMRPAYSNYGSGLAGLIVANVSGLPWEAYAERHLLEPLGMSSSTFREPWGVGRPDPPMTPELAARVSRGYQRRAGAFVPGTFEFIGQIGPAGALSTSATDMARWMLVHLGEGELDGVRILRRETAQRMQRQHFTADPALPGIAHGFIESQIGGYRAIGHGGGTVHFVSDMQLIPELGLGVFISTNTAGAGGLVVREFVDSLVERFFPDPSGGAADAATAAAAEVEAADAVARRARLAELAGAYLPTRRAVTTIERLLNTTEVDVRVTEDAVLLLTSPLGPMRLREIAPDTFRFEDDGRTARFVRAPDGSVAYLAAGMPIQVMEPVGPFGNPVNLLMLLAGAAAVLICVPVGAWLRRTRPPVQTTLERHAGTLAVVTALVWIGTGGIALIGLVPLQADFSNVFYAFPNTAIRVALGLSMVGALLTVLSCLLLVPVWRSGSWPFWRRVRHTLVVGAALVTLLVLRDLNAIGFQFIA